MGPRIALSTLVIFCCVVLSLSAAKPKRVRIYVFTALQGADGWVAPDFDDRQDSVKDLKRILPSRRIGCVGKDAANVHLEVLRRGDGVGLTVRLTVPGIGYGTDITADSPTWRGMALEIIKRIDVWLDGNLERLPE